MSYEACDDRDGPPIFGQKFMRRPDGEGEGGRGEKEMDPPERSVFGRGGWRKMERWCGKRFIRVSRLISPIFA